MTFDRQFEGSEHEQAAMLANEIGLPGGLWQIEVALGDLYTSSGEMEQAYQTFVRAGAMVQGLAERIEDEELRTNFLAAPAVQRVVELGRA